MHIVVERLAEGLRELVEGQAIESVEEELNELFLARGQQAVDVDEHGQSEVVGRDIGSLELADLPPDLLPKLCEVVLDPSRTDGGVADLDALAVFAVGLGVLAGILAVAVLVAVLDLDARAAVVGLALHVDDRVVCVLHGQNLATVIHEPPALRRRVDHLVLAAEKTDRLAADCPGLGERGLLHDIEVPLDERREARATLAPGFRVALPDLLRVLLDFLTVAASNSLISFFARLDLP